MPSAILDYADGAKAGVKVCDAIAAEISNGHRFYSLEFFPPSTVDGARNLVSRVDRLGHSDPPPLFVDVTWTLEGGKRALETLVASKAVCGLQVQMHLSCTGLTQSMADAVLEDAIEAGVRSLLIIRGDPAPGQTSWQPTPDGFQTAKDLVSYVRRKHGAAFSISVAGLPPLGAAGVRAVKDKVDAGADFVITQVCFDAGEYTSFVADCRSAGVECPIVPGVLLPPPSTSSLTSVCTHCGVTPPPGLITCMEAAAAGKGGGEAVRVAGCDWTLELCKALLDAGAPGIYLYTLNLEKTASDIISKLPLSTGLPKAHPHMLPFPRARHEETVRPIFWASNPLTYLARTHGSKGDVHVLQTNHSLVGRRLGSAAERRYMWGEAPTCYEDIYDVFDRFVRGKVPRLPWCDRIEGETVEGGLLKPLAAINHNGFLTINSQPILNGVPSDDPTYGWGPTGGLVYQRAYLEFFCSEENKDRLLSVLESFPDISVQAYRADGQHVARRGGGGAVYGESGERLVTAVTWGVFDDSEVLQPTVVDSAAFDLWKDEAFAMWLSAWASVYPEGSQSKALVEGIHDTFWHFCMLDNDFVNGNIFAPFAKILSVDPTAGSPVIRPMPAAQGTPLYTLD